MTLTKFLLARIAEDEQTARLVVAANHGERDFYATKGMPDYPADAEGDFEFTGPVDGPEGWAAVYVGPARVLAECAAKRAIVEQCAAIPSRWQYDAESALADSLLERLAAVYANHPDYREEWKP